MLPLIARIREAVDCHVAALPVPYRTTDGEPSFQSLTDPGCDCLPGDRPFPTALDPLLCNRYEIAEFGREALRARRPLPRRVLRRRRRTRSAAWPRRSGRTPPASRYSPDMTRHAFLGTDDAIPDEYRAYAPKL